MDSKPDLKPDSLKKILKSSLTIQTFSVLRCIVYPYGNIINIIANNYIILSR